MRFYDLRSGVWPTTGWWNSANALNALTNYMIVSGDHRYLWVVENTFTKKRNAARGNFINDFTDDTGWWALAWISAYDLTGDTRYLQTAQRDVDFMWSHHDDVCGGGLWWTVNHGYKNAISNELFVQAAAELAQRLGDGGSVYLDRAVSVWNWFEASGMINDELLVNDGLYAATCRNNGDTTWTYNQGVLLGGLVALARATGDDRYLERARKLADASTTLRDAQRRRRAHRAVRADRLRRQRPQLQGHLRPQPRRAQPRPGRPPLQRLPAASGIDRVRQQPHREQRIRAALGGADQAGQWRHPAKRRRPPGRRPTGRRRRGDRHQPAAVGQPNPLGRTLDRNAAGTTEAANDPATRRRPGPRAGSDRRVPPDQMAALSWSRRADPAER